MSTNENDLPNMSVETERGGVKDDAEKVFHGLILPKPKSVSVRVVEEVGKSKLLIETVRHYEKIDLPAEGKKTS